MKAALSKPSFCRGCSIQKSLAGWTLPHHHQDLNFIRVSDCLYINHFFSEPTYADCHAMRFVREKIPYSRPSSRQLSSLQELRRRYVRRRQRSRGNFPADTTRLKRSTGHFERGWPARMGNLGHGRRGRIGTAAGCRTHDSRRLRRNGRSRNATGGSEWPDWDNCTAERALRSPSNQSAVPSATKNHQQHEHGFTQPDHDEQ
jgi:hypothetical protein